MKLFRKCEECDKRLEIGKRTLGAQKNYGVDDKKRFLCIDCYRAWRERR